MASTEKELVDELQEATIAKASKKSIDLIIKRAKAGHYHDFKSNMVMPKIALVRDLEGIGLRELARRVERGEFDENYPTDEEALELRRKILHDTDSTIT